MRRRNEEAGFIPLPLGLLASQSVIWNSWLMDSPLGTDPLLQVSPPLCLMGWWQGQLPGRTESFS